MKIYCIFDQLRKCKVKRMLNIKCTNIIHSRKATNLSRQSPSFSDSTRMRQFSRASLPTKSRPCFSLSPGSAGRNSNKARLGKSKRIGRRARAKIRRIWPAIGTVHKRGDDQPAEFCRFHTEVAVESGAITG